MDKDEESLKKELVETKRVNEIWIKYRFEVRHLAVGGPVFYLNEKITNIELKGNNYCLVSYYTFDDGGPIEQEFIVGYDWKGERGGSWRVKEISETGEPDKAQVSGDERREQINKIVIPIVIKTMNLIESYCINIFEKALPNNKMLREAFDAVKIW